MFLFTLLPIAFSNQMDFLAQYYTPVPIKKYKQIGFYANGFTKELQPYQFDILKNSFEMIFSPMWCVFIEFSLVHSTFRYGRIISLSISSNSIFSIDLCKFFFRSVYRFEFLSNFSIVSFDSIIFFLIYLCLQLVWLRMVRKQWCNYATDVADAQYQRIAQILEIHVGQNHVSTWKWFIHAVSEW